MTGVDNHNAKRRGRHSKDEQLARAHQLPVTAVDISMMTLTEFQRLMRDDTLNNAQRALIRKIRRRGWLRNYRHRYYRCIIQAGGRVTHIRNTVIVVRPIQ